MPKMGERERQRRKRAAELFVLLCEGLDDDEARDVLDVTQGQYDILKEDMFAYQAEALRGQTTERVYLEYVIAQRACVADLTDMLRRFDREKNSNAMVGAVRARSDIIDKMIKLGQDFGFLEKRPEEKRIIGGVVVAQLNDDQLRQLIAKELAGIHSLVQQHGEQSIMDVDPGELHYSLPEAEPAPLPPKRQPNRTQKAKANKTHKGRRVVKEKTLQ